MTAFSYDSDFALKQPLENAPMRVNAFFYKRGWSLRATDFINLEAFEPRWQDDWVKDALELKIIL